MFKTKLVLVTTLFITALTGCLTDDTKTIDEDTGVDPSLERNDNDDVPGDEPSDDTDCRVLKNGEVDCPLE